MNTVRKLILASAVAGTALSTGAGAVNFTLNNTGGAEMGTQARKGFEIATAYWASVLTDNVNVSLDIGFSSLGENILGQTHSSSAVALTQAAYAALAADASSSLDASAVATLRPLTPSASFGGLGALTVTTNAFGGTPSLAGAYSDSGTRIDNDGSANNVALSVNTATMKALGFSQDANGDPFDTPDGSVKFSSDFAFDFDPTDGITAGQIDFIGVAIHEIGHALGFVSGVDTYDYFTFNIATGNIRGLLEDYAVGSTLDLFRYSGAGVLDWSTSDSDKYFSIDGGVSRFNGNASFATGVYNGDGDQASHWKAPPSGPGQCTNFIGIMNPYLCDSTGAIVTGDDLAAFDAMGWDINFDVLSNPNYRFTTADAYRQYNAGAVPEPATWAMMIGGFGLIGGAMRRRTMRPAIA